MILIFVPGEKGKKMADEYIVELGKALYDPDTGAAVFKPEFREKLVRCRDCEWYKTNYTWNGKERKVCGIEPFEPMRREEDYCAYGERSER